MNLRLRATAALLGCTSLAAETLSECGLERARDLRAAARGGDGGFEMVCDPTTPRGPRMGRGDGEKRAVGWAQKMLREQGFDPVWTEPATFPVWRRYGQSVKVVSPASQPLTALALGFSPSTPEGGIESEVVMLDDLEALENVSEDEVAGRIIFVRNRMERTRSGAGYGQAVGVRSGGARIAAAKGAAALVIRSIGTSDNRFAHAGMQRHEKDVDMVPALAISNPDADLLERLMAGDETVKMQVEVDAETIDAHTSYNVIGEKTRGGNT